MEEASLLSVDKDEHKQGGLLALSAKELPIVPLEALEQVDDYILLITSSYYEQIVHDLEAYDFLDGVEYVVLSKLQSQLTDIASAAAVIKESATPLIPRTIHYCWFGGKPLPAEAKECIASWKDHCPDYEVKRWDESNINLAAYPYLRQAYDAGKYAFVSDLARLMILQEHGGIYLDVDVRLLRPLDDFLYQRGFCGVEKWGYINSGLGIGACKGNEYISMILTSRKGESFRRADGSINATTCGIYETRPLLALGFEPNNKLQTIMDMNIYPADFFCPYNYMTDQLHITDNTFSVHGFSGSWK